MFLNFIHSLLYLAFVKHKMGVDEGTKWVLGKLERDWNRLTLPEANFKEILGHRKHIVALRR